MIVFSDRRFTVILVTTAIVLFLVAKLFLAAGR